MKAVTGILIIILSIVYVHACAGYFGWSGTFAPNNAEACVCTGIAYVITAIGMAVIASQK